MRTEQEIRERLAEQEIRERLETIKLVLQLPDDTEKARTSIKELMWVLESAEK